MIVRKLITMIAFQVNKSGLNAAASATSRIKQALGGIGGASASAGASFSPQCCDDVGLGFPCHIGPVANQVVLVGHCWLAWADCRSDGCGLLGQCHQVGSG